MKKFKYNKPVHILIMMILFLISISWTVHFRLMSFDDLRIIAILIIGTTILILISKESISDYKLALSKIRFNLFFVGVLMSLLLLYDSLTNLELFLSIGLFLLCLKPMVFVILLYLPVHNILNSKVLENPIDETSIRLSRRESEVLEQITKGLTNKEISNELYIAENTVKKHVQNILKKTKKTDRVMLMEEYNRDKGKKDIIN